MRDPLKRLTGGREPNQDASDILRTLVALTYGLEKTGLTLHAFGKKHVDRNRDENSNLIRKWATGETAARPKSIARLESSVPGIVAVYSHPVFDLLRDRLKAAAVSRSRPGSTAKPNSPACTSPRGRIGQREREAVVTQAHGEITGRHIVCERKVDRPKTRFGGRFKPLEKWQFRE